MSTLYIIRTLVGNKIIDNSDVPYDRDFTVIHSSVDFVTMLLSIFYH